MNGTPENVLLQFAPVVNHRTGEPHPNPQKFSQQKTQVWIYGLFSSDGVCHYVGQTWNPYNRWKNHCMDRKSKFWQEKLTLQMRILRCCSESDSTRLEIQVWSAYKRRSQCRMNQQTPRYSNNRGMVIIYSEKEQRFFRGHHQAAVYFGYCTKSIMDQIKGTRENYYGLCYVE